MANLPESTPGTRHALTVHRPSPITWRSTLEVKGYLISHSPSDAGEPFPMAGTTASTRQEKVHLPHATSASPFQEFCAGQEPAPDLPAPSFDGMGRRGPSLWKALSAFLFE